MLIDWSYYFQGKCNFRFIKTIPLQKPKPKMKYRFELELDHIMLNIPHGCNVLVEWGRKNSKVRSFCSLQKLPNTQSVYMIKAQQKIAMQQKISTDLNSILKRQNFIKVILQKNGVQKLGGSLKFDISQALKANSISGKTKFDCRLENTPDPKSYIKFWMHYAFLEEVPNFCSSTGSFRYNSPSNTSRSPESERRKPALVTINTKISSQSPKNIKFTHFKIDQHQKSYPQQFLREAQIKISQLLTSITSFKNELHIKTKEVQMLRDNERLLTEQVQRERIQMNKKVLTTFSEINELEEHYKRVKKDNNFLQVQVERLKMELIRSQRSKERVEEEIFSLKEQVRIMEGKSQENLVYLKQENERLKFELFETQSRIFKLQSEYQQRQVSKQEQSEFSTAKLSQLEYQNITLVRTLRDMEQKRSEQEDRARSLEIFAKEKSVENETLRQKISKMQKQSMKEHEFSQSAYVLLQERYQVTSQQLEEKREILSNIRYEYEQVVKEKDQEIELLRKKFNSFMHKIELNV